MSQLIVLLVFVAGAGLVAWSASRLRRFEAAYRYDSGFRGTRYPATWRLPQYEAPYHGFVGADQSALYLFKPSRPKSFMDRLRHEYAEFRYDLRIPWRDIEWRTRRVLLRKSVWFEVPTHEISFYLPAGIGNELLADAGLTSLHPAERI